MDLKLWGLNKIEIVIRILKIITYSIWIIFSMQLCILKAFVQDKFNIN